MDTHCTITASEKIAECFQKLFPPAGLATVTSPTELHAPLETQQTNHKT